MSHGRSHRVANRQRLVVVLTLTSLFLIAEVVGGLLTGSLALLADAGHMLTDVAGLAMALLAMKFSERPATPERTYGYYRTEILAALANALILVGVSLFILLEAYERFRIPKPVASGAMLAVASIGLAVNLGGAYALRAGSAESLNVRGAYFEVLSDLLSSVGVILAALVMWLTGWYWADPAVSAAIGVFILPRTWALLREAIGVLLEGTPAHIDLAAVRREMESVPGVARVHDLHVWTITSGMYALSAHAVLADGAAYDQVTEELRRCITAFRISHVTLQVEKSGCGDVQEPCLKAREEVN